MYVIPLSAPPPPQIDNTCKSDFQTDTQIDKDGKAHILLLVKFLHKLAVHFLNFDC